MSDSRQAGAVPDAVLLPRRGLLGLGLALATGACPAVPASRAPASDKLLPALIPDDVLLDYQRFLAGRDPVGIADFGGPHARRDVIEVLLIQQALARQDSELRLSLMPMPTSQRLQAELRSGHAACSATSYWREDFPQSDGLLFSDPVLDEGEFEVGLYTTPDHERALSARSLRELQGLRVLSNRSWRVDWLTLEQLGFTDLQHVASWNLMPRMLQQGRADLLLAPFQPTPDLSMTVEGVRLVPVPGLKLRMRGTRHFLVSHTHPLGPRLREQLNAGLARLRQQGLVRRAYEQCGFFNARVAGWTRL
ncbi:ABC transporter substrate-binding protein [Mitsuaria sp. WAJ17]|uniref:ABC transporter substrate-binding protein n=1 Tax=Mitsuaria sp. WAJ17 TaxID=2761452 RepID=UPI001603FAFE|nr:ABC transporter substrate-binding protein [Mitsuaria sp. WAJ17]MBB2486208.1 ABC transporter substrate-binding protein [Mitsuaria sp. WAJ17]